MPDFSQLLHPPVESTLPPPVLPEELYPGIISSHPEFGENTNKNPYARLQVSITGWPEGVPESDRYQTDPETGVVAPIDPTRRKMSKDFFLTDAAYYRLDNFLKSMGKDVPVVNGAKDYETPLNNLLGERVLIEVRQIISNRTNEAINVSGDIYPYRP